MKIKNLESKLTCLLSILFSMLVLSACNSDDSETETIKEELIGTWVGEVSEIYENTKFITISTLTFKSNGNLECEYANGGDWWGYELDEPVVYEDLKYSVKGNILTIKGKYIGEDKSQKYEYKINLSGGALKLTFINGLRIWGSSTITFKESGNKYKFAPEEITYHRR